ncbi:ABC transporter ATP-binding protein [Ancylobacter sp. GSK1Z-4-2]|nr:ABC transporter ATP-binding protein [Ancylobacter mangrovi]MCS0503170.1 ABC transporter ATP-binding protein [Ancylobacter mangrovi]
MPPIPIVRYDRVSKSYTRGAPVVRDLSLDIMPGEFLTLLGPSGSGKTTTLMMLAGFDEPSEGQIYLNGRDLADVPAYRRNLGVVFQNYALFPHLSVADNVGYPLRMRGIRRAQAGEKVRAALDMVRLGAFADRKPTQLSGGQQQRVALARALVFEPEMVLMDEPLGALDKQLREHMQVEMKDLQRRLGLTVLYVTHDQGEALAMSDRVAVFNNGRIEQIGGPRELYEAPLTPFVAQFIGENNRLCGKIETIEGNKCRVALEGAHIVASPVGTLAAGAAVELSIRPERMVLAAPGEADALPASVIDVTYLGDHCRLRLSALGGETLMVKLPIQQVPERLLPGQPVGVRWDPVHCRAMTAPASAAGTRPQQEND